MNLYIFLLTSTFPKCAKDTHTLVRMVTTDVDAAEAALKKAKQVWTKTRKKCVVDKDMEWLFTAELRGGVMLRLEIVRHSSHPVVTL